MGRPHCKVEGHKHMELLAKTGNCRLCNLTPVLAYHAVQQATLTQLRKEWYDSSGRLEMDGMTLEELEVQHSCRVGSYTVHDACQRCFLRLVTRGQRKRYQPAVKDCPLLLKENSSSISPDVD
jgi:hypothetical protein